MSPTPDGQRDEGEPPRRRLIPFVIDGNRTPDREVYSRLLKERVIFIGSEIDDAVANVIMAQLLFLQFEDKARDIHLYLNSPGGSVTAGLAIYDTMKFVKNDIATYCVGQAAGMAAILLAAGKLGKRFTLPRARVQLTPLYRGLHPGVGEDPEKLAAELVRLEQTIHGILSQHTGWTTTEIGEAMRLGRHFSAEEARAFGLVDEIIAALPH
jgi:ATP-dependent Clp protease protease subunit